MFQKSPTEAVETERYCFHTSLAGLELDEICTLDDTIVNSGVESTSGVVVFFWRFQIELIEMFHEMSHPDRTWTFRLRLRSLKIKPLKLRCSTVGRLSLEDGLLVGKMRMDGVSFIKIQFKKFIIYCMHLLNTVASRFVILFQLRWFISDWLCCDICARVIWWVIQFWSAWSNHDDVWHVRDVHFPRLFWFKYAWICLICDEHSINATTLSAYHL